MAGIIAAIKNNSMGIAGIAGRNNNDTNTGVSLYGIRIFGGVGYFQNTLDKIATAIVTIIIDTGDVKKHHY